VSDEARELAQLDNWVAEFSLTDESDVLDEFTLDEQAKIWGLMRTAWNTARERTRKAALEEAAQAFEAAYSDHEEPLIGVMYGLKAIRSLAERASKGAGGGRETE
jgi:hypothetical protein